MTAYAQNVTMTGTVVDTDNLPLIGVNVVIKGTSTGTTTDLDGKFTLTGENGQTLVFSYIGMTLQEIVYKGKPLHVIMKDDSKALEEVVIIGYQTVKKSDLTGAVAVVDTKEMKKSSAGTLVSQMQDGTFCRMVRRAYACSKVKHFRCGAEAKASLNRASSQLYSTRNRVT